MEQEDRQENGQPRTLRHQETDPARHDGEGNQHPSQRRIKHETIDWLTVINSNWVTRRKKDEDIKVVFPIVDRDQPRSGVRMVVEGAKTYTDLYDFDGTGHGPSQPGDFLWRLVRRVEPADRYAGYKVKRSEVLALVLLRMRKPDAVGGALLILPDTAQ
jgi:hypothetical protein